MTKKEFFNKILETTAEVCSVTTEEIMNGCRREDVCGARSIVVFWCDVAGFTCASLLNCTGRRGPNSIKAIQKNIEYYWVNRFAYHMLLTEVGKRLLEYAKSIGEEFDLQIPLKHVSKITGKYYQNFDQTDK